MTADAALLQLCRALVADPYVVAEGWSKVVLAGTVGDTHAGMHGYLFYAVGNSWPVAPRNGDVFDLIRALRDAMAAADPAHPPWVACLLTLEASGRIVSDFEYSDAERWHVTPANHEERRREFASA